MDKIHLQEIGMKNDVERRWYFTAVAAYFVPARALHITLTVLAVLILIAIGTTNLAAAAFLPRMLLVKDDVGQHA